MIYELRTYTVKPGTLGDMVKAASTVSREIRGDNYGKLEGYWMTEIGPLNQTAIKLRDTIQKIPGAVDIGLSSKGLKPEIEVDVAHPSEVTSFPRVRLEPIVDRTDHLP